MIRTSEEESEEGHAGALVLINPETRPLSEAMVTDWEGCLSIPDIRGQVPRPEAIAVEALSADGEALGLEMRGRAARIVLRDVDLNACNQRAAFVADGLNRIAGTFPPDAPVRLRGPHPPPIARIADQHRSEIEILAPAPSNVQRLLTAARNEGLIAASASMMIDVDPIALL